MHGRNTTTRLRLIIIEILRFVLSGDTGLVRENESLINSRKRTGEATDEALKMDIQRCKTEGR
jgi:hypothetical protein